ncbi:peptidase M15 [Gardnerella vaginalis]|uniref:Peptidase M15 n=1 Tax=Gardnerella vaginalis TaxID=2702 RepID=A0A3E1IQC8_GARVA|nr:D-alanyl-D-alanine carboxypeptidase [Gardnerella vaginalis]MBF9308197.1 peptidase M15 [Bifidobacteriaceae bacterium NR043]MBF9354159.1 peptidase M15 [Bifidobacteriaceae bacterium NR044]RFD75205.1 peptidase M15 [Gardnerella vaginalis]RFT38064.1 peptidase M15 [Bifidobacteriaceae bacterium NR003]
MESSKGSNDALNTLNASAPKSSDSLEQIDSKKPSKYAAMVLRSQYPSRWRFLIASLSAILSLVIMVTYVSLDVCDILPGPLTLRLQHKSTVVSSPRALLSVPSLAKGATYGKPINREQSQKLIDALIADPSISDNTSVVIMDANGSVIASHEANTPREPASTLKTLTAAVASRTLDMGSTLDTQVFLLPKSVKDSEQSSGSKSVSKSGSNLRKIVLRGNGDMLLGVGENDWSHVNGRAGLTTLAKRTAAALKLDNIHEVSLSLDDSLFGAKRAPALVYETDTERRFYAETSSMAIDDARQRDLQILGIDADAITDFPLSDPHPALSVGQVFARLLIKQGIEVRNYSDKTDKKAENSTENYLDSSKNSEDENKSEDSQNPEIEVSETRSLISENSRLLAQVSSAPLNEVMSYMLRLSDNTLAEEFGRLTAIAAHKSNSPKGAVQAVEEGLRKLKISTRGLNMSDCSGLSPKSHVLVTTLAKVQVLNINADSGGAASSEGLSLPGLVGTSRKRLADESAAGLLRVKTGSLSEVSSMSGNVSRKSGGVLTFAVVANQPYDFWGAFVAINKFMAQLPNL